MKYVLGVLLVFGLMSTSLAQLVGSGANAGDPDFVTDHLGVFITVPCVNIIDVIGKDAVFEFSAPGNAGQGFQQIQLEHIFEIDVTTNCPITTGNNSANRKIDVMVGGPLGPIPVFDPSLIGYSLNFSEEASGTQNAVGIGSNPGIINSPSLDLGLPASIALVEDLNNIALTGKQVKMTLDTGGNTLPAALTNAQVTLIFTLVDNN